MIDTRNFHAQLVPLDWLPSDELDETCLLVSARER